MVSFSLNKSGLFLLSFIDPTQKYFCKFTFLPVPYRLSFLNKVPYPFNNYFYFSFVHNLNSFPFHCTLFSGMVFCSTAPKNHSLSTLEIFKDLSCIAISLVNKNPTPF